MQSLKARFYDGKGNGGAERRRRRQRQRRGRNDGRKPQPFQNPDGLIG